MSEENPTRRVSLSDPDPQVPAVDGTRRVSLETPADGTRRVLLSEPPPLTGRVTTLGFLQPGHVLLDRYEVVETLNPHETERPGIFVCRVGASAVVVKVAALRFPPKPEMWEKLTSLSHSNVLKVFDTLERDGLYYEVQEYCAGRSLANRLAVEKMSPDWVIERLVPQVNEGLKYLHSQGIVHRDIKPANIFLRDNDWHAPIVLGDFDISAVLASDKTSRDTKRGAGTWEYMPPEAFPRFVDNSAGEKAARVTRTADYYSLGVTIIELILGTTSLHSSDLPDLFDFYLSGGQIELPSGPPPLVRLLRGLLIRNRHKRWSGEQVDRWIAQQNTYEDMQAILDDEYFSLQRSVNPYSIGVMHATDLPGLADLLDRHPDEAIGDLLNSNRLIDWVARLDMSVARAIEKDRELWRSEPDNCVFRCIMMLDRTRPFPILGLGKAATKKEWIEKIAASKKGPEQIAAGPCSFSEIRKLDSWLHLKPDAEPELANRVGATLWQPSEIRFEEIAYTLDPTLLYSHERSALETLRLPPEQRTGASTPEEIVAHAYGDEKDWAKGIPVCYQQAYQRWKAGFLEAWMRGRGLGAQATVARAAAEEMKDHPHMAFQAFLRALDPKTEELRIEFLPEDLGQGCQVVYGEVGSVKLRYRTRGVGVPLAALRVIAPTGVSISPTLLDKREGMVTMTVDARAGVSVSKQARAATIEMHKGNCALAGERPVVRFKILPSGRMAASRVFLGAFLGLFVMTGARLGVLAIMGGAPINPTLNWRGLFRNAYAWHFEGLWYVLALGLALMWLYVGFRIWIWGLKKSDL